MNLGKPTENKRLATALGLALLGAFMNCFIRGGLIKVALGREIPGLRIINALIFGVCAWQLSSSLLTGGLLLAGMLSGSALPLGNFIRAMLGDDPAHDEAWGYMRMTLRGALWGATIAASALIASHWHPMPHLWLFCGLAVFCGAMQGVITLFFIDLKRVGYLPETKWLNAWTLPEIVHGPFMWLPLLYLAS